MIKQLRVAVLLSIALAGCRQPSGSLTDGTRLSPASIEFMINEKVYIDVKKGKGVEIIDVRGSNNL